MSDNNTPPLQKNSTLRSILGFGISGFFLWLTFHKSGLKLNNLGLNNSELFYFVIADIAFIISVWVYSVRARLFWLNARSGLKDIHTLDSVFIGNFYNLVFPGNLGDGMRAWHFSRKNKVPFLQALAPIFSEKWLDAQFFVFLTAGLLLARPFVKDYVLYSIIYTSVAVIGLWGIYVLMRNNRRVEKIMLTPFLLLKATGKALLRIYWFATRGITDMRKRGYLFKYIMLCSGIYVLNVLQFYFLLKVAGITGPVLSMYTAYLCAVSMMIISIIPSAPGNIGVLHYGLYLALILSASQSGIQPGQQALQCYARFGVFVHLSYLVPELTIGALFVIKERKLIF